MALLADVIIAGESAQFMAGFTRLGVVPDCLTLFTLPRLIGLARTRNLLMTNGTLTAKDALDLGLAAKVVAGKHVSKSLKQALVVPGSRAVKVEAEAEGLDKIFVAAGFEWRDAGCSMCIGMNDDVLLSGERSASTSNRNFEGRQGKGSRTHLVSPMMAAAAAIEGHFVDIRKWSAAEGAE